jgi:hypothetical protein|tara:strand:+ start:1179 stop:2465 length:1287 start_codon:yes stop_codon:yes gene_type:complete
MATSYKTLLADDITPVRSKLHEAIPITGSILSGTYGANILLPDSTLNWKFYAHDMFVSVYDYPYLSSSANHIFDITDGIAKDSFVSASTTTQIDQKLQLYSQMALVLAGNDATGSINELDVMGDFLGPNNDEFIGVGNGPSKMKEALFYNFARLLSKDEIQKGSFKMVLGVNPTGSATAPAVVSSYFDGLGATGDRFVEITDFSASANVFKVNSPAGEYGILYATASALTDADAGSGGRKYPIMFNDAKTYSAAHGGGIPCGLVFYQAGIAVLSSSLFQVQVSGGLLNNLLTEGADSGKGMMIEMGNKGLTAGDDNIEAVFVSASISQSASPLLGRIYDLSFNNTTELNSTVYFCRADSKEFNYSSNPTYLLNSKIRVKETRTDQPSTYVTSVGLYGADNSLLATAKTSEPIKKQPSNEFTLRVRLDY